MQYRTVAVLPIGGHRPLMDVFSQLILQVALGYSSQRSSTKSYSSRLVRTVQTYLNCPKEEYRLIGYNFLAISPVERVFFNCSASLVKKTNVWLMNSAVIEA